MTGAYRPGIPGVTTVYSVDTQQRLASVHVVFFGQYGAVTDLAQQRGQSRQVLYREAHSVARVLDGTGQAEQIAALQQEVLCLQRQVEALTQRLAQAVLLDTDKQAEFASVSQAEGVSLPLARRLLQLLLGKRTPSVAQLGRWTKEAARRATATLAVLDDFSRPLVEDAALDELFVRSSPVLMAVELGSLVWVTGQLSPSRDGDAWAEQLRQLTALRFVSRDAGNGLDAGIAQIDAERAEQHKSPLDDQDDHFHLLREGTRALRRQQGAVSAAIEKAEKADKKRDRVARQGKTTSGTASAAKRAWTRAEAAFQRFSAADDAWTRLRREVLPLWLPSGQLNTRQRAEAVLAEVLPALQSPEWDKVRRLLRRPGFFTFLDRVSRELDGLPVARELVQAAVEVEGARRRPEASAGTGPGAQGYRAVVLVAAVILAAAQEQAAWALRLVRGVLGRAYRASSAVEGLNSIVRMHQGRHRRLTQSLLDLKRLNWNGRTFRTGKRRKQTPYGLLGLQL